MTMTTHKATEADVDELMARLCAADRREVEAACIEDLRGSMLRADINALRWRGELVGLYGCEPCSDDQTVASPWLLCTDTIDRVSKRAMAEIAVEVVSRWMDGRWRVLANAVHAANHRAVAFVRWLGFEVIEDPVGPGGAFWLFRWEAPRDV